MSDVLLLSGSIPALAAALDLASVGIRVRVAPGIEPQIPTEPVRDLEDGTIAGFLGELAEPLAEGGEAWTAALPSTSRPAPVALRAKDGSWKPQPQPAVWGIPAVPLATDCINLLGSGTAFRAYLDRLKPVLTIGKEENLAKLVDSRFGARVRELLVEPVVFERLGVPAAEVNVGLIAPGLNEALTRAGSLSGAALVYSERYVARETHVQPAAGWAELGRALFDRLMLFGASRLDSPLTSVEAVNDGKAWAAKSEAGYTHVFDALVLDGLSDLPGSGEVTSEIAALSRGRVRLYAEIGIEPPKTADESGDSRDTLELCEDSQGSTWSVRVHQTEDARWRALLGSASVEQSQLVSAGAEPTQILEHLGYVPTDEPPKVRYVTAPYTTHAEAEASRLSLESWHNANPAVLLTGTEYFGGELAPALADARDHAVSLRRRLTGIA